MNISTIAIESRDQILMLTPWTKIMISQPLFQDIVILRGPGAASFADIIKIAIISIKNEMRNYNSKQNFYLFFPI